MKNIQISEVKNGWIVRSGGVSNMYEVFTDVHVYHTIKEIQDALPMLLADNKQPGEKDLLA